jgi:anaerobic selenocysteine-containing dehydrogenase
MLIQSTNPMAVAPEQRKVRSGFMREDLFVAVHEHFMTETAQVADIVLPATMFLEHDDIYQASGHSTIQFAGKLVEPPAECRSNHEVVSALAGRLGARHPGFEMTARELADATLKASGWPGVDELEKGEHGAFLEMHPDFETGHYLKGFNWPDKKFRFKPDWSTVPSRNEGVVGPVALMPRLPDHWEITEAPDAAHPFRLATSPARAYLNSTFGETRSSNEKHGRPEAMMHPDDLARLGIAAGQRIIVGNGRGEIRVRAKAFAGLRPGVVVIESIPPNAHFEGGEGVNTLTSADQGAPYGGAVFHDTRVWVRAA